MTRLTREAAKTLVDIVDRDGAVAALVKSKRFSKTALAESAKELGITVVPKDSKSTIASAIVRRVDRRIDKTIDDLMSMSREELIQYFEDTHCHQDELIELLDTLNFRSRARSRRDLVEFAAIQISSLGVFERVANGGHRCATP